MKTIAQQLNIKEFPFIITDKKGNRIYFENSDGCWWKSEYDERDNEIYFENSDGYWWKSEYDERDNETYFENSDGYWWKSEYDDGTNDTIYWEDSYGIIKDNRPKPKPEYTMEQLVKMLGEDFKLIK